MQRFILFSIFLLQFQISFSQTEKLIHGKVLDNDFPIQGVKVINLNSEKSIITNNNGDFLIAVKPNDMLVFYELEYNYKRKQVTEKEIYDDYIIIKLEKKPVVLNEVVIEKSKIDAMSTGVLTKPAKEYTPAERKLRTATTGLIDPLINWITGRTDNLKKQLTIEKCEMRLAKLTTIYDDDFYKNKLNIETDYIKAFQYFAIYDEQFINAMKAKNRTMMTFRIIELAREFKELLKEAPNKKDTIK